ncbi:hypothetical protein T11_14536, partial [Trichinella zimbabwensis]
MYKHITTIQYLEIVKHCINYFSEDFDFHHSSHCSVLFICTQQVRKFWKYLQVFVMGCVKCESIKELDAENEC